MFEFLERLMSGGGDSFSIEGYDIRSPIKLPKPVRTPLGGRVSVVRPLVDIVYRITDGKIVLLRVAMSAKGGTISGSTTRLNIIADKTGEAFYVPTIEPESLLYDHVIKDIDEPRSYLRSHMFGTAGLDAPRTWSVPRVDAVEDGPTSSLVSQLVGLAGADGLLAFIYDSPRRGPEPRVVTVQKFDNDCVYAIDHKDGTRKKFLLSRITNASRPD